MPKAFPPPSGPGGQRVPPAQRPQQGRNSGLRSAPGGLCSGMLAAVEEHPHRAALAIMLSFALVRLWIAASGQIDLAQDEAQYWDWSRRLQLSYYSKGPLIAWIIAAWTAVFGNSELGVRFGALLGNLGVQGLLYFWLAALLRRPRLGLITLCLANTTPLFIVSGVLMTTDNPLLLCWTGGLVCLTALTERPRVFWPFLGLAAAMGFGILAKYTMLAFGGVALLYAWRLHRRRMLPPGQGRNLLLALGLGTALGCAPILAWNLQNDFVSFRHVAGLAGLSSQSAAAVTWKYFPEYLASQAGLLLPWWLAFMLWQGWKLIVACMDFPGGLQNAAAKPPRTRGTSPAGGWILHAGGTHAPALPEREPVHPPDASAAGYRLHLLLCLGFWPLWLFFLLWSFHTRIYPNWSAMSYAAGMVIAALGVERVWLATRRKYEERAGNAFGKSTPRAAGSSSPAAGGTVAQGPANGAKALRVCAALSLAVCLGIHGQHILTSLIPLPDAINPTVRLKGWSELGKKLDEVRRSMPNPEAVFFFSNSYDVTAALAFYVPGNPVAYCADFGRRASQYDLWPDPNGDAPAFGAFPARDGGLTDRNSALFAQQAAANRAEGDDPLWFARHNAPFGLGLPGGPDAIFVTRKPMGRPPAQLFAMFRDASAPPVTFQSVHQGQRGREFGYVPLYGFTGEWPKPRWNKY